MDRDAIILALLATVALVAAFVLAVVLPRVQDAAVIGGAI